MSDKTRPDGMPETSVDPFDFFNTAYRYADRLFEPGSLAEVLILTTRDGIETEAILPIGEYRRLVSEDARRAKGRDAR